MTSRLIWRCLGVVFSCNVFAQTSAVSQIFTPLDWQTKDPILFVLKHPYPSAITEIRMAFLSGEDCYSGYQNHSRISSDTPLILEPNQPFGLNPAHMYHIAKNLLDAETLQKTQAVLIRFVDHHHGQRYAQFAWFEGFCHDQDINCCIPITCSKITETCQPKYAMGTQFISWVE